MLKQIKATCEPHEALAIERALELRDKHWNDDLKQVMVQYAERLSLEGFHGVYHWERVLINGLMLAQMLPLVNEDAVFFFSLFHDCKREDEGADRMHGPRGAQYFMEVCSEYPDMTRSAMVQVYDACFDHTNVIHVSDPTVAACLDADRLDLYRVGIYPDIVLLNYQSAITDQLIYERVQRSKSTTPVPIFRDLL